MAPLLHPEIGAVSAISSQQGQQRAGIKVGSQTTQAAGCRPSIRAGSF